MTDQPWHKTDFDDIRVLVLWNLASGNISVGKACDVLNGGDPSMPMSAEQAEMYYAGELEQNEPPTP